MSDDTFLTDEEFSRRVRRGCLIEFLISTGIVIGSLLVLVFCISRGILGEWTVWVYILVHFVGAIWELRNFGGYNPSTALMD